MMNDLSKKIFKNADEITVIKDGAETVSMGVITSYTSEYIDGIKEFGLVSSPLFLYMGNFQSLERGDKLVWDGDTFSVIESRVVKGFNRIFCARAVIEKIVGGEG